MPTSLPWLLAALALLGCFGRVEGDDGVWGNGAGPGTGGAGSGGVTTGGATGRPSSGTGGTAPGAGGTLTGGGDGGGTCSCDFRGFVQFRRAGRLLSFGDPPPIELPTPGGTCTADVPVATRSACDTQWSILACGADGCLRLTTSQAEGDAQFLWLSEETNTALQIEGGTLWIEKDKKGVVHGTFNFSLEAQDDPTVTEGFFLLCDATANWCD